MNKEKLIIVCVCGLTPIKEAIAGYRCAVGMCRNNIAKKDVEDFLKMLSDALDKYRERVVAVIEGEGHQEKVSAEASSLAETDKRMALAAKAIEESSKEMVRAAQALADALSSMPETVQVKITDQAVGV